MKRLLPLIFFVGIFATIVYRRNPGVKAKVDNIVNNKLGWTEEARKGNPAAFIDHAIDQLGNDKTTFQAQRVSYTNIRSETEASLAAAEMKVAKANEFAEGIRMAYSKASTEASWPVEFSGESYTEDQLVTQVSTILHEKTAHEESIGTFKTILSDIEDQDAALVKRINAIDGQIIKLKASKQQAEMKKLTADSDAMLAKVNELLIDNTAAIADTGASSSPIRSLDDLKTMGEQAAEKATEDKAEMVANKEVMDFLKGI